MVKNYPTLKNLAPLLFLLFAFGFINAQVAQQNFIDVTNDITTPVCAGSNITVNFRAKNGNKSDEYYNNNSIYYVYISVDGSNSLTLLKTYSTSGVTYCGTNNCYTYLQTNITIPTNLTTGSYRIRIYSDLPDMKWYSPSNAFTVNQLPIAPSGPVSGSRCGTGAVSLSVTNPDAGFAIDWYSASTGGSVLTGGLGTSNFTTPSISSTTTYYAETINTLTGCVSSSRTAVSATVNTIPTITSNTPNSRCGTGTVSLSATASAGTINWYAASTGGVSLGTGTSYTTPSISATAIYYVDATNNGCTTTARTAITATVNPFPLASGPITGTPTVCQSQNNVAYSVPAITNATGYTWAYSGTGATITGATNNITINFAANATSGNLTVYGINSCGNGTVSANYAITVNSLPTAPTTTSASICSGSSATLAASGAILGQSYNWYTVPSGGSSVNTTNSYNTPAIIATTNYWVSIVNSNGCESTRTIVTANIYANNRWTGSTSTNWNTAGNWCIGVPTIGVANTLDVLIPSGLTNYPIIYASDAPGYVKTIVLENNTTLNVRENSLRVVNNLTLNGLIDLEGESQLLQDTGSTFDAASTGSIEIDQQGTGNSFRYNYWSSPVNSRGTKFTIDEVLRNGTNPTTPITYGAAYAFAEQNIDSSPIQLSTYWMYVLRNSGAGYAAWYRVGNTGEILVGEGYTMKGSNTSAALQNYTFVGKPNNGNISLTLNAGFDYLVGNPYPSAINAAQFLLDNTSTTGEIYFWEHYGGDTHNLAGYQAGYATRNLLDAVPATSAVGVSNLVPPGLIKKIPGPYIAVGQAFFVVGGAVNSQIQFNNGQRDFVKESSGNAVFMKSSNSKAKTEKTQAADLRPKFRIGFDAPKISHRQLLLGVDERATKAVDWGFDAEIYEIFADDMYWMLDGKKYVIQGTNAIGLNSEVPLGIQLSKTGMVTIKIDALENVDDDTTIYLKDKLTGEIFNMRDKPVQLNLTAGKYADRFVLVFKTQKLVAEDVKAEILIPTASQPIIEGIHVFMNNAIGELQIKNNSGDEILSVALINALGQTIQTWNSNFNIRTISLPINTATGVYLVQINTKTGKTVKKISVE